jgi:hypothetical protein
MGRRLTNFVLTVLLVTGGGTSAAIAAGQADPSPTEADPAAPPGSLAAMLRLMPPLPHGGGAVAEVRYADMATQLAAVGVPAARSGGEPSEAWQQATSGLELPFTQFFWLPAWPEVFRFGLGEIDQTVEYSKTPLNLTLNRDRFDRAAVLAAWANEGYRPVAIGNVTIYSVRDDFELDLAAASAKLTMNGANHAAILDDATIAFSSVRDVVVGSVEAAAGRGTQLRR